VGIRWTPYALVRVTFFFICGIVTAICFPQLATVKHALTTCLVFIGTYVTLWFFLTRRRFHTFNLVLAVFSFASFFSLGYLNSILFDGRNEENHLVHYSDVSAYKVVVADNGQEKPATHRFLGRVLAVRDSGVWKPSNGRVYLYLSKGMTLPGYGDVLLMSGAPRKLYPPQNPGEFDYKRFLAFKNIYHQHFIRKGFKKIASDQGNPVIALSYRLRDWAQDQFTHYIPGERERSIALALVLGIKDGLDNEIMNAYAASGAMHVLAVSGLHLGIIYLLISFLLHGLQNDKYGRWILALVSLTVLWGYAMMTGFTPSVLRAATMFSFLSIAKTSRRKTNIYNTLAASALLLLVVQPWLIMSVGFQLSYMAVLGIVFLQPKIYNLLSTESWFLDKVWSITAVSIAAQLATFPLGLYYFHQFPSLFFITNLVVIPGAFLILVGGLSLLLFSIIPVIAGAIGYMLKGVVSVVNFIVLGIEKIPYSHVTDLYITPEQQWYIIGFTLFLSLFLVYKRFPLFSLFGFFAALFLMSAGMRTYHNLSKDSITFYRISGHTAIDLISQRKSTLWTDSVLAQNSNKKGFHIAPNHLMSAVNAWDIRTGASSGLKGLKIMVVGGKKIAVLNGLHPTLTFTEKPQVDYLVYGRGCRKDIAWLRDNFDFGLLILDGSLYRSRADILKQQAEERGLNYYSVFHEGALQVII